MTKPKPAPFWQRKTLAEMSKTEWESLCDGCGKCCLLKLEYEDDGEIVYTEVACKLLDTQTARCGDYARRKNLVPDCVKLTADDHEALAAMPPSCAYRLLSEGQDLPEWHPLVSGRTETVHLAGMSVRHRVISEAEIVDEQDMLDHVVTWPLRR
jgi:uncharacterized cysteine cluster protein YcgN (CxxCxxCC family)